MRRRRGIGEFLICGWHVGRSKKLLRTLALMPVIYRSWRRLSSKSATLPKSKTVPPTTRPTSSHRFTTSGSSKLTQPAHPTSAILKSAGSTTFFTSTRNRSRSLSIHSQAAARHLRSHEPGEPGSDTTAKVMAGLHRDHPCAGDRQMVVAANALRYSRP